MRNPSQRRLRHRIPVRLRHHWKLVAVTGAVVVVLVGVFGSGMIRPYVGSTEAAARVTVTEDIAGTKDVLDTTTSHDVRITFNDANYQTMLQEYFDTGEKEYVSADIVIDGTTIKDVGIRLKGNSTLMGLTWNGERRASGRPGGGQLPEGFQPPEGFGPPGGNAGGDAGAGQGQQGQGRPGAGMGLSGEFKAEEPETLPWLIRFDEFVEGRRYQGHSQIAVRPAGGSSAELREALAISLVGEAGEPSQRFAYSSFTVNGRSSAPRLLVEYLDEGYAERLGNGVLYKALASGQFSDQGGDQTDYGDDFKQINRTGSQDLQHVIDLIRWVEQASDEEFAAGLADRLDVESFARYVALQNLVLNFDDMAGPGANYYLWYDLDTRKFTVISWDMNLAFSGDATAGPHDTVGMDMEGGPRPGGGQQPEGAQPPEGRQPPAGMQPRGAGQGPDAGPQGGMRLGGHALKERFLETDAFRQVYDEQYRQLYSELLASGRALELLHSLAESYQRNDNADRAQVASGLQSLRTTLETRTNALRSEVVAGGK